MKAFTTAAILSYIASASAGTTVWSGNFDYFNSASDFDNWYVILHLQLSPSSYHGAPTGRGQTKLAHINGISMVMNQPPTTLI